MKPVSSKGMVPIDTPLEDGLGALNLGSRFLATHKREASAHAEKLSVSFSVSLLFQSSVLLTELTPGEEMPSPHYKGPPRYNHHIVSASAKDKKLLKDSK